MIAYILSNLCFMFRNVCNKEFTNRFSGKQNNMFFNAICLSITCIISAFMGGVQRPSSIVLLLAAIFGIDFIGTVSVMLISFAKGPMGLVNLIFNLCAVVPMTVGLVVFHQKLSIYNVFGLFCVLAILLLAWFDGESKKSSAEKKVYISPKIWLPVTLLAAGMNGVLSSLQSMFVQWGGDTPVAVFNFWAYLIGALVGWVALLVMKLKGADFSQVKKMPMAFSVTSVACGLLASGGNILIMYAIYTIPSAIAYPLQSCLLTVAAYLIALFYYKEARTKNGIILVLLTLISIVLFSL